MTSRTKIIFAVLAIGAVLVGAYLLFSPKDTNPSALSAVDANALASSAEVKFLNLSTQVAPLTFDTTIFSDPRFTALRDIHTAVQPEQVGRRDPFAGLP